MMNWYRVSQTVKHVSISRVHIQLLLLSLAFSRRSFSKTERSGTRYDGSGGVIKRGSFVSVRVGSGEPLEPTRPKPNSFFGSPWVSRPLLSTSFYSLYASNRLCYHSISCQIKVLCEQTRELPHDFFRLCLMLSGLGNCVVDCHI